jgi:uncharacterized membrane protein
MKPRFAIRGRTVYWGLAALILAAIVHILFVFSMPLFARDTAWRRLGSALPANSMRLLAPVTPESQILPYMAPDVRYAICRFDLAAGPLLVKSRMLDGPWSVTLYTPQGENYFAMTSADLPKSDLELTVNPPVQRSLIETVQAMFARPQRTARELREVVLAVTAPAREGLAVIRAPLMGLAFERETEAALQAASCANQRRGR